MMQSQPALASLPGGSLAKAAGPARAPGGPPARWQDRERNAPTSICAFSSCQLVGSAGPGGIASGRCGVLDQRPRLLL
jgi:hypothetical protein